MARISGTLALDAGSVNNSHLSNAAADIIDADKLQHVYSPTANFGLEYNATPAAKVFVIYQAQKTGVVRSFNAGLYAGGSSTSITFDLKKNGTSVLSGVVTVTNSDGNRSQVAGTITTPAYSAGDVFTVHLATSSTTGAQGPYATAAFEDSGAP
jgi:hypothetical protein